MDSTALARPSRLAALAALDLDDSSVHLTFDRLAQFAARLLHAPAALVSLVGADAQRFPGQVGLPQPWATLRATPLSHSICQHVVTTDAPLGIADARVHPLVHDSLAIPDLGVIAYLGVPLHNAEEEVLGTLCAIDHAPRNWSEEEVATLSSFAQSVSTELQLRQARHIQRETAAQLRMSERHLRLLTEHIDAVFWVASPDSRTIHYISPGYERFWGLPLESLRADPHAFLAAVHPDDRDHVRTTISQPRPQGSDLTYRILRPDASTIWVRDRGFPVTDESGTLQRMVGIITDITRERAMEEALRLSEAQYRLLFEDHPQPMWVFDRETLAFLEVNNAAVARYGYSRDEFLAMTIRDIRPPEEVPALQELVQASHAGLMQSEGGWRHRRRDGTTFEVEVTRHTLTFAGRPAGLVMAQDVTERRQLEAQLRQSQKLESLGRLAGGVAHDFNNLLTVIGGYAELLALDPPASEHGRAEAQAILQATSRASALTRQLLAFARRQPVTPRLLNLNQLVETSGTMLRRLIGEHFTLVVEINPALRPVFIDPGQFEQVLMNLVVNARDAMPAGGTITVATTQLNAPSSEGQWPMGLLGPHALVTVRDTGTGMVPEVLAQAFEPFFTTKPAGKGTGLGLAVVHGVVTQADGRVWATSEPGRGTTVTIALPHAHLPHAEAAASEASQPISGGDETILLVEDDPHVRELAAQALRGYGYQVRVAVDGGDALTQAQPDPPQLLVTDVRLPQQTGPEVAARLRVLYPELRVLFISGALEEAGDSPLPAPLLPKPFTPRSLAQAVRAVLDNQDREKS